MKEEKLSFAKTLGNDWYALKLGFSISKSLVINAFCMRLAGYFEWVFFDAIFLREIVGALDQGKVLATSLPLSLSAESSFA